MKKQSAGILLYRKNGNNIEVLLGHAGGPFWQKKDMGAWSIPKGEYEPDEEPLKAAYREFEEETGQAVPSGEPLELGSMKRKDGKIIQVWAIEGEIDEQHITSDTFELEWPPKSGQMQTFPEIDRAMWCPLQKAPAKMHKGQDIFIKRLVEHLGLNLPNQDTPADSKVTQQTVLF